MKKLLFVPVSLCAVTAVASLVPVGPVPFSGTGLGSVNTVLTVGGRPIESGCVARGPAGDILGPAACPSGFSGGDEKTGASQTQTRTIAELGLTTATDLRIVLNVNESTGNSVTLTGLSLRIYDPSGAILFSSGAFIPPTFPLTHSPGTTVGYVFQLDAAQAAQAQLVFAGTNRIGLATTLSGATAGDETFFVADVTAIGTPITGADMAVMKAATPTVIAGTNVTYTINAVNNGPVSATNAVVSDPLPAQTVFTSLVAPAGWSCTTPAAGAGGTVTCTKPTVAVGETALFTITARICSETACTTTVTDTATAASATIDPVTLNGTASASTLVQAQSDLAIAKNASAVAINPGGTIIYTVTVSNAGPSNSAGTTAVDTLPAGFTVLNIATTAGSCSGVGTGTVSCALGTLGAPGQCLTVLPTSATVTITAQAPVAAAPGTYTNTATTATGNCLPDPNLANNTAIVNTMIPASPVDADVAITKIAPPTAIAGNNLTYNLSVTNSGPQSASSVTVSDALPAQTRFVSHTPPPGWSCTTPAAGATGTITCTKATVAVAESGVFTTVVRICPETACGTSLTNTATASSATNDPVPANNTATATVSVQAQADVSIAKTASSPSVIPGGVITYTLTVNNAGPSNSAGTTVVDTLPPDFTAVSATSSAGTCSGAGTPTIACTLGTIGAANQCTTSFPGTATITIVAQVATTATPATATNTATVATTNCLPDPVMANNTASAITSVGGGAVTGVPTVSEIGLLILGALLLIAGAWFVKSV